MLLWLAVARLELHLRCVTFSTGLASVVPGADGLEIVEVVIITSNDVIDFSCWFSADVAGLFGADLT